MAFEGHICCCYIYGNSVVNQVGVYWGLSYYSAVIWGLHVDYIASAVGCTSAM